MQVNKIVCTLGLMVFLFTNTIGQGIDDVLPDKIGTGTHNTIIKSTASLLAMALRSGAAPDVLRYKNVVSVEYHNGTSWVSYNTTDWKYVLDGVDGNGWNIPYSQVRFTIDLGGTWIRPSAFLIGQDWYNGERSYDLTVESSSNQTSWNTKLAATSTGSSNPSLNIFMVDQEMGVDRYVRLTIQSVADAANPLGLRQVSAFTKRFVGLTGNSTLPFYSDFDRNIGIGTSSIPSGYKLAVDGKAIMEEVKVEVSEAWPDYVFSEDYDLKSLEETEAYIKTNKHLPGIPSAEEVSETGIALGEMNAKLLEKVEELTLHLIEQNQQIAELKGRLEDRSDSSGKKVEELMLYIIAQNEKLDKLALSEMELLRQMASQRDEISDLKSRVEELSEK